MRVSVISNCQGEGMAAALKALNPALETSFMLSTGIHNGSIDLANVFANSDFVLAQRGALPSIPEGEDHKVKLFPSIVFDAFHPDVTFVRGKRKELGHIETTPNHMSIYHSALTLFGYINGFSVDQTIELFNDDVMLRLGYLNKWDSAREALLAEGEAVGMPLAAEFYRWTARGSFMHSHNHPHIRVIVDVAKRVMTDLKIPIINHNVADYLPDNLIGLSVWPVYPPIARALGVTGDYAFKGHEPSRLMNLREFIEGSYSFFDYYEKDTLESLVVPLDEVARLFNTPKLEKQAGNPYKNADSRQFWKSSVASVEVGALDPVFTTKLAIGKQDKVATAGSCFAQHIARTLSKSGFDYYVPESAPSDATPEEAYEKNYGVFSARYGNIYTVRQLVQLIDRAYGRFSPEEQYWLRKDGAYVDPFRPQIEPAGFKDVESLLASRDVHFAAVREMLENMNVFVFTLGLTEGWRSKIDGAVFPLAPGVAGGELDFNQHEFVNFSVDDVTGDLLRALDLIRAINPACSVILTVSPVPLIATYEPQHALVSTTYSKSVLRVAAQRVASIVRDVDYFGSFEIITGSYNRGAYFESDLRTVTDAGVAHVMGVFMKHYAETAEGRPVEKVSASSAATAHSRKLFDIVCDEEVIANF